MSTQKNNIRATLLTYSQMLWGETHPELKLYVEIIAQGYEDKDVDYFRSIEFEEHCDLLKLNPEYVLKVIKENTPETQNEACKVN